jgi:hypothetical protein
LARLTFGDDWVHRDPDLLAEFGAPLTFMIEMEELVSSRSGEWIPDDIRSTEPNRFLRLLIGPDGRALLLTHADTSRELSLPAYKITSVGRQILGLIKAEANLDYHESSARSSSRWVYRRLGDDRQIAS